ncbi:MAG: hypothetical protein AAF266_15310 [Planctomycetota bacterium]
MILASCFVASAVVYGALLLLGPNYALAVPINERPLLTVLALYVLAFVFYYVGLHAALSLPSTRSFMLAIVGSSIALRTLLLPTPPFQEIDIYRYLWDGAVTAEGVDPYAHSPQLVVDALDGAEPSSAKLLRLRDLAERQPPLAEIVRTIHYSELPSPYPPVSPAVFAAAAATTPDSWSAFARLVWLKAWITAFDVATLLVVIAMLRRLDKPIGWAVAYGWCPLVLKEIAGSGHLDAIAVFFTTASVAAGVYAVTGQKKVRLAFAASLLLSLGVGAKLYPIVLAPWLAAGLMARFGWRRTLACAAAFVATGLACLWPMFGGANEPSPPQQTITPPVVAAVAGGDAESLPPPRTLGATDTPSAKTEGLSAFLSEWEMNDLLFMVVYENLRWHGDTPAEIAPWFDFTPDAWSASLRNADTRAFLVTRALTGAVFALIAIVLSWRSTRRLGRDTADVDSWIRAAFLTIAWFWLLAPTQNPWYWCWALPLIPWASGRAWLAMSATVMAYYLRFWLASEFPDPGLAGTPYNGEYFFYFVVPWVEFVPVLAWLAVEAVRANRGTVLDREPT